MRNDASPDDSFTLTFTLSEADFRRAHRAYLRRSLLSVKNLFLVTIALLIGAVQAQLFGGAHWALRVFGSLWLAVVGLVLFVYIRMPSRIYRTNRGLTGEQRVRVDRDGAEWSIDGMTRRLTWKEIARASLLSDYLYIHPRHGLPWILPRSAFPSDDELRAFDEFFGKMLFDS